MTDELSGLLTQSERAVLTGQQSAGDGDAVSRSEVIERLCGRVSATMSDFELLYLTLTDEELRTVFEGADEGSRASVRAAAQYVLALLYYGLVETGDDVEYRLASAVRQAEADRGMHAAVEIDVVTEPFLPPEQRVAAIREDGFGRVSFEAFDRLFYDERLPAEELATVLSMELGMDVTPDTIREGRDEAMNFERVPTPVITSVEAETISEET